MVSLESLHSNPSPVDLISSPRISFSSEFLDESNFISICPNPRGEVERATTMATVAHNVDFEFLSENNSTDMMTADELFREGKMLPFWQMHNVAKLNAIHLKTNNGLHEEARQEENAGTATTTRDDGRVKWLLDDDPSPRPPNCIVLWKELLRLKKQRSSTLSSSLSSSSSSSSSSSFSSNVSSKSLGQESATKEERKETVKDKDKGGKRCKKGQERRSTGSIRIRPVINVPICTTGTGKSSGLPPLFSLRKARVDR